MAQLTRKTERKPKPVPTLEPVDCWDEPAMIGSIFIRDLELENAAIVWAERS